jgi:hypothetical protein
MHVVHVGSSGMVYTIRISGGGNVRGVAHGIMFTLGRVQCQNAEIGIPGLWPYSCIQKYTIPRYSSHYEDRTLSPLDHSLSIHAISYSATQCSLLL